MKERYKFISAVYLLLIKENKILLLKRQNTGYEDAKYSLVSGHIDGNETIKQAMIREAKEEAGIIIHEEDIEIATFLHRKTEPERLDFFLKCNKWNGEITNAEPDKCSELTWYDINRLPNNIIPCVKKAIENYQNNIIFDNFGWESKC